MRDMSASHITAATEGQWSELSDREGVPAYLEASCPDNARLYRRLGFRTLEIVRPLGSPPLELMLREPSA